MDISGITKANSKQVNAVDLINTTMDITVTKVEVNKGKKDQKVDVFFDNADDKTFKPCLTMQRVLQFVWGSETKAWVGKSMRLYCDMKIKWGGKCVGGVRISHVSHIDKQTDIPLRESSNAAKIWRIKVLAPPVAPPQEPGAATPPKQDWEAWCDKATVTMDEFKAYCNAGKMPALSAMEKKDRDQVYASAVEVGARIREWVGSL